MTRQLLQPHQLPKPVRIALADQLLAGFVWWPYSCTQHGDDRHEFYVLSIEIEKPDDPDELEPHLYVVVADAHADGGRPRMHSLAHAVHVLQNVGEHEGYEIENRGPEARR